MTEARAQHEREQAVGEGEGADREGVEGPALAEVEDAERPRLRCWLGKLPGLDRNRSGRQLHNLHEDILFH